MEFLNYEFLGNSITNYLYFSASFLIGLLMIIPIRLFISKLLFKLFGKDNDQNDNEKFNSLMKKPLQWFLILLVLYFSTQFVSLPEFLNSPEEGSVELGKYFGKGYNLLLLITIFWTISRSIDFIGFKLKNKALKTESKVDDQLIPFAIDIAKVLTIVLGIVMILGNVFDVNVTALVTGLGIGGVAFALASKESLENLLGSFTIFFDKPFTVGDTVTLYITVDAAQDDSLERTATIPAVTPSSNYTALPDAIAATSSISVVTMYQLVVIPTENIVPSVGRREDASPAAYALMRHYSPGARGDNIFIINGTTVQSYLPADWGTVTRWIYGGHESPKDLTTEEESVLLAAGYSFRVGPE